MAIEVNLDLILVKRKMSLTELSNSVGITMANLSILKQGHARAIRFSTLEKLCEVLECQPGDLLSYRKEDYSSEDKNTRKKGEL
jgi:putative transcriptional regulator